MVSVRYTLTVPPEAAGQEGSFWNAILIEPADEPEPVVSQSGRVGLRVRQVFRYAVHVVTHLGSGGQPAVEMLDTQFVNLEGARQLLVDVRNGGTRVVRPQVWLEPYTADGRPAGRFEGARPLVYPGLGTTVTVNLADLPAGRYEALLFIDDGTDELTGVRMQLDLPAPPGDTGQAARR